MYYDVMPHLVFVYVGLNCASLSVALVFETEQSYSRIISCGCERASKIYHVQVGGRAAQLRNKAYSKWEMEQEVLDCVSGVPRYIIYLYKKEM